MTDLSMEDPNIVILTTEFSNPVEAQYFLSLQRGILVKAIADKLDRELMALSEEETGG